MTIKYTPDHEWVQLDGGIATATTGAIVTVGITHHAQDALGDVVFVDLPEVGKSYAQKDAAGVVESVKAAADVYMPVSGRPGAGQHRPAGCGLVLQGQALGRVATGRAHGRNQLQQIFRRPLKP
jgi:hypothetical protein